MDQQDFERNERRLVEVCEVRRVVSWKGCQSNHASRDSLVRREGGEGVSKSFSMGSRVGQSVRAQLGERGGGEKIEYARTI